jgi:hypothetical protein
MQRQICDSGSHVYNLAVRRKMSMRESGMVSERGSDASGIGREVGVLTDFSQVMTYAHMG